MVEKNIDEVALSDNSEWWQRNVTWRLLRGFGQSWPAAITMSAPFIGYLILYHSQIAQYLGGLGGLLEDYAVTGRCARILEFSMRLNLIYVALLILGIGTIVYRIFAPEIVKSAKSDTEYILGAIDTASARTLQLMFATIARLRPASASELKVRAPWLVGGEGPKMAADMLTRDDGQIKVDVLRCYYETLNGWTFRWPLYFVIVCYVIGFLMLTIPGVAFSVRVVCVIRYDVFGG